jgi:hypothetical protein
LNWASRVAKRMSRRNDGIDHRGGKRREGENFLTELPTNKEARLCDLRVGSFCQCLSPHLSSVQPQPLSLNGSRVGCSAYKIRNIPYLIDDLHPTLELLGLLFEPH